MKYIQIKHLNECDFVNYQFFPLMTFMGEITELYLEQVNFFEILVPISNKETKIQSFNVKDKLVPEQRVFVAKS